MAKIKEIREIEPREKEIEPEPIADEELEEEDFPAEELVEEDLSKDKLEEEDLSAEELVEEDLSKDKLEEEPLVDIGEVETSTALSTAAPTKSEEVWGKKSLEETIENELVEIESPEDEEEIEERYSPSEEVAGSDLYSEINSREDNFYGESTPGNDMYSAPAGGDLYNAGSSGRDLYGAATKTGELYSAQVDENTALYTPGAQKNNGEDPFTLRHANESQLEIEGRKMSGARDPSSRREGKDDNKYAA